MNGHKSSTQIEIADQSTQVGESIPLATTTSRRRNNQFSHVHFNPCSSFKVIFARLVRLGLIFSALDGKKSGWRISAL